MNSANRIALLHGWATDASIWNPVVEELERRRFSVAVHEMPGYGSRMKDNGSLDLDGLVGDAIDVLQESSIWVGWSLGAMIALRASVKRPEVVRGVLGVCATAKFCLTPEKETSLKQLRQAVATDPVKAVKRFQASMLSAENRWKLRKRIPPCSASVVARQTLLAGLDVLARADLSREVNKIDVPVKLIGGTDDEIIPSSSGEILHRLIPNSTFTPLPCGHLPFLECPQLFVEQLVEFAQTITESKTGPKPV